MTRAGRRTRAGTRAWWTRTASFLLLLCLLGCPRTGQRTGHSSELPRSWHYRVRLHESLEHLDVEVCFDGPAPRELRAGSKEATSRLQHARWLGPGAVRRLRVERGRIQIDTSERNGCVGYSIELSESGSEHAAVRRVGEDLLASPNTWLWRPTRLAVDATASLQVALPEGMEALLPWPRKGNERVLARDAFRFDSYAAFGRFEPLLASYRGVQLELALLDGELAIDEAAALRWLRSGLDVLATADGPLPIERLSAIVLPAGEQAVPVPFGMVARGGGASLLLLVSSTATEQALTTDWVLPHELSHLLLPFIEREHAWLSEGLATYYQELLRARAGVQSERTTLTTMVRSLRDAAHSESSASVIEESARMRRSHAYRKVYWGGAAFWLVSDVRLRRLSRGKASLDSVLAALRAEGALERVWSARALVTKLDALAGVPVFSRAWEEAAAQPFPPFEPTLDGLGIGFTDGALDLDDARGAAHVRRALLSPPR